MNYTSSFFEDIEETSATSARIIVPWLAEVFQPASVIDVGCGAGVWLCEFIESGVNDVVGLDGASLEAGELRIPAERFARADFSKPLRIEPSRTFDLVVSLEVAEHLPEQSAPMFIQGLCELGSTVVFSAAVPKQGGVGHLNEQWPTYWIEIFMRHSFACQDVIRPRFWDHEGVAPWYAQNMLLFQRVGSASTGALRLSTAESFNGRALIHPRQYFRKIDNLEHPSSYSLPKLIRILPGRLAKALRHRIRFGDNRHL